MLDPISRGAIVAMSALSVAGAIALAPVRVRSSIEPATMHRIGVAGIPIVTPAVPNVDIRRDPFAAEPSPNPTASAAANTAVAPNAIPALVRGDVGPLPSNLAGGVVPAMPDDANTSAGAPRVTAVVTGAHRYAMFDTGGNHEIKGIGDRVSGKPIVAIDIDGVTLQGGQRLTVNPGELSR